MRAWIILLLCLLVTADAADGIKQNWDQVREMYKKNQSERRKKTPSEAKYFQEPGRGEYGHYDKRYFNGTLAYYERLDTLRHLVRAWLQWSQREGIETWLAHGTLLGWWWNAQILPWDTDLDVQVSEDTLRRMAKEYNRTTWAYDWPEDGFKREYLLDINPHYISRLRGEAANMIDGRWIDTRTGMFIDITGLSETHPKTRPDIIVCKNYHRYHKNDIYPLRETRFEQAKSYIPNYYDKILLKEYRSKALTVTEYEGHMWEPSQKAWIKSPLVNTTHYRPVTMRGGKRVMMKREDPRGLDRVEETSFMDNVWRLVHYW